MITFSLQSGSNGNSIYVEAGDVRLLFDAGISGRQARLRVAAYDRDIRDVDALLVSHAHRDHVACAGIYQRQFHFPIYATSATRAAITACGGAVSVRTFRPGDTLTFDRVSVHTLPTPHDADESVAFIVEYDARRLGILTDLGHPFPALATTLRHLHAAYLESNYDPQMLAEGPYPAWLKARIRGDGGHLSNDEAAELLHRCGRHRPRWAALAHLSEENNRPELALRTHRKLLGREYPLCVVGRHGVSDLFRV